MSNCLSHLREIAYCPRCSHYIAGIHSCQFYQIIQSSNWLWNLESQSLLIVLEQLTAGFCMKMIQKTPPEGYKFVMSEHPTPSHHRGASCSPVADQGLVCLAWSQEERLVLLVLLACCTGYIGGCWLFAPNAISSDRDGWEEDIWSKKRTTVANLRARVYE